MRIAKPSTATNAIAASRRRSAEMESQMPQVPPEIIFDGMERTGWVEEYVGQRLQKLEKLAPGLTRCQVTLRREQSSHKTGNPYSVTVEVRLPPQHDVVATKEKAIRDMPNELPAVVNLAFGAIERQLKKTTALRRHDEKTHDVAEHGLVEQVCDGEYGFIRTLLGERQIYFHRNSVLRDDFDRLTVGTEVRFTAEQGEEGPQASSVQVLGKPTAN
jgi:cold shock CspA family protein/ribosome-associated translation inhibitor RaiA